jgi:hypothetical protein
MNKKKIEKIKDQAEMLPEYDFTGMKGVRGKYFKDYRQGHTVKIHQPDGSISTQHFTLEDGAVILEPDLRPYFPTAESVNTALRALVAIIPAQPVKTMSDERQGKGRVNGQKKSSLTKSIREDRADYRSGKEKKSGR